MLLLLLYLLTTHSTLIAGAGLLDGLSDVPEDVAGFFDKFANDTLGGLQDIAHKKGDKLIEALWDFPEDGKLNFTGFIDKYGSGAVAELHEVVTEDGYILGLHHIQGDKKRLPVFLQHGLGDSGDAFLRRGTTSLGINLINAGYDVWFGNFRGTLYSRRHKTLTDRDPEFWNFSFHENAIYDLAASIDYVLNNTGHSQLNIITFSLGTTASFVLGSMKPEFNDKINLNIAMAPIAYLQNVGPPTSIVLNLAPFMNELAEKLKLEEIVGPYSPLGAILKGICLLRPQNIGYKICAYVGIFPICGLDPSDYEASFSYILLSAYPYTLSRKLLYHSSQLKNGFRQFDYGSSDNLVLYNSTEPAAYELDKCTTKTVLVVGQNDRLATVLDVEKLRQQMPNIVEYFLVPRKEFNHLDPAWGRTSHIYLHPKIFELLEQYSVVK